jgi:3-hydroxyisobutyrate dehydrogenase-like beta-hydroxyacid dehydrogenase
MKIGFIGLGIMGTPMALHLVDAGHQLYVRTRGKVPEAIAASTAQACAHPAEVTSHADVVFMMVPDTPDVEAVLFGEDGVAQGLASGGLVIDCSTISPGATAGFAKRLAGADVAFVDAPVSGGSEGARNATLTIMVGGEPEAFERARPVLEAMGKTVTLFGPAGSGQAVKAVNQVILAGTYLGVAEGIVLALKAGLDPVAVAGALDGGAARSWVLENRSGRMIDNAYPLGFRTSLHLKDLVIALEMARGLGATLPVAGMAAQLEAGLVARGHGDEDMSNLARAIRSLSGLDG